MMRRRSNLLLWWPATLLLSVSLAGAETLVEMARSGDWGAVLQVARVRSKQLPLSGAESLVAAHAAGQHGEDALRREFLALAAADEELAQVAAAELALELVDDAPARALSLVTDHLHNPRTRELRAAAAAVAERAVAALTPAELEARQAALSQLRLARSERRRLALAQLKAGGEGSAGALVRLLEQSTADLVALDAAEILALRDGLGPERRWLVAQTYFRHALYAQAEPLLEGLMESDSRAVPRWEVAFTRGRCAFRRGRWAEARSWYERALQHATGRERRADLEVHLARSFELDGRLDEALMPAVRAVQSKTTDDRRLFLARLRLRHGEAGKAEFGVARLRSRQARDRGQMLLALDALTRGKDADARDRLARISRAPWKGPAVVLTAQLDAAAESWTAMIERLDGAAGSFDVYWATRARGLMAAAPPAVRADWRQRLEAELPRLSGQRLARRLGAWATLEVDEAQLARAGAAIVEAAGLAAEQGSEFAADSLAGRLWGLGLQESAVRWDSRGFPAASAVQSFWSARQLLAHGSPERSISVADRAWRQALPQVPLRAYPRPLRLTAYPLPDPAAVRRAAATAGLPWTLLAGVAREESRWRADTLSVVGARGVMQLMPSTAAAVAERLELEAPERDELFDAALSLRLGAAELARLLEVFGGRPAVAVAAYNAGEAQAALWLEQCGPTCNEERFMQTITFSVTRGYVEKVLASAAAYAELYPSHAAERSAPNERSE